MLLPLVAAVAGALAMGVTKPKTAYVKAQSLGSRTGQLYEIEDFPSAGFVVARANDGSEGVFQRKARGGFLWAKGRGHAGTLRSMRLDFGVPEELPKAEAPK